MLQPDPPPPPELHGFTVRWPVLTFFSIDMIVFLAFLLISVWWMAEQVKSDLQVEYVQQMGTHVQNLLDMERRILHEHLSIVAKMRPLSAAFLAGDREQLLAESQPLMDVLQEQQISDWVFYRPDLTKFLRVDHPARMEDEPQHQTVLSARKTGQLVFGVEAGRIGVPTFRVAIPWQVNGKTIGYQAWDKEAVHLVNRLRERTGISLFPFFHKKYLDKESLLNGCNQLNLRADWEAHRELVSVIPVGDQVPEEMQAYLQSEKWRAEPFQHTAFNLSHSDQKHLFFTIPVKNSDNVTVMWIVASVENYSVEHLLQTQPLLFSKFATVVALLLGWLFYHYLSKVEVRVQKAAMRIWEIEKSLIKAQQIAQIGNWEWQPDVAILSCSEQVRRILALDDTTPLTSLDILFAKVPVEEQTKIQSALNRFLVSNHQNLNLEYRLLLSDGEPHYVHLRAEAVRDASSAALPALFGTLQDVTKLKQLEFLAKKSTAFLKYAIESREDGILLTDEQGKIVYYNARFLAMWHISRELAEQGRERKILECIQPQLKEPQTFLGQMEQMYASQEVGVDLLALKDGRYLERHTYPIMGATGLLGREWRFVDITDRYRADQWEQRAIQSRVGLSALLEIALEPLELPTQLQKALEIILAMPWLAVPRKGSIFLVDEIGGGDLIMAAHVGLPPQLVTACARIQLGHCLCGRAALGRKIFFAPHMDEQHEIHMEEMDPHGHYCVPILSRSSVLGVLNLYVSDSHQRHEEEEAFLITVANLLAGFIKTR